MMDIVWYALAVVGAVAIVKGLVIIALGGDRLGVSFRAWWRALRDPAFAARVRPMLEVAETGPAKPSGVPLRFLAVLQRDGRLIDFLMEDVSGATDEQVGHGVRDIHAKCKQALAKAADLTPVLPQAEGDSVEVPVGFDPSAVRLVGNVTGQPPYRGTLKHAGWRVEGSRPPARHAEEHGLARHPAAVQLPGRGVVQEPQGAARRGAAPPDLGEARVGGAKP